MVTEYIKNEVRQYTSHYINLRSTNCLPNTNAAPASLALTIYIYIFSIKLFHYFSLFK